MLSISLRRLLPRGIVGVLPLGLLVLSVLLLLGCLPLP